MSQLNLSPKSQNAVADFAAWRCSDTAATAMPASARIAISTNKTRLVAAELVLYAAGLSGVALTANYTRFYRKALASETLLLSEELHQTASSEIISPWRPYTLAPVRASP